MYRFLAEDALLIMSDGSNIRKFALGDAQAFSKPFLKVCNVSSLLLNT